ncbi:MAG: hypothetical protein IJP07_04790, partial [Firmicutes bacterium]|nr:hypothetical protein [Bacillota bacterium]
KFANLPNPVCPLQAGFVLSLLFMISHWQQWQLLSGSCHCASGVSFLARLTLFSGKTFLFLKEKKQKNFNFCPAACNRRIGPRVKVSRFLFSKRKDFRENGLLHIEKRPPKRRSFVYLKLVQIIL